MKYDNCKFGAAVLVKFMGPTDHRPARYKASFIDSEGRDIKSITESYEYGERNGEQPFRMACDLVVRNVDAFWRNKDKPLHAVVNDVVQAEHPQGYLFIISYGV